MKQTIVALIRPNLNLSQNESQVTHLIEHLLHSPSRLKNIGVSDTFYAENIIDSGGNINDFYATEYFVVKSESATIIAQMIIKHQNELYLDVDNFECGKSALTEELNENRGEFIGISEQLSKAIFIKGSPTIRNPWDDLKSIKGITADKTLKVFHKYNTNLSLLILSFDNATIDKLPIIERNVLRKPDGTIELTHPWQSPGCFDVVCIVPLPTQIDILTTTLYRQSLTDARFGLLYNELRHKLGLVYDVSTTFDYDNNTLDIDFSSSKENLNKVTKLIINTLKNYNKDVETIFEHIKGQLKLDIELEWSDVQTQCLPIIEMVVSGGYTETPASMVKRIETITAQDLIKFNILFLDSLNKNALTVIRRHGKSVSTK